MRKKNAFCLFDLSWTRLRCTATIDGIDGIDGKRWWVAAWLELYFTQYVGMKKNLVPDKAKGRVQKQTKKKSLIRRVLAFRAVLAVRQTAARSFGFWLHITGLDAAAYTHNLPAISHVVAI